MARDPITVMRSGEDLASVQARERGELARADRHGVGVDNPPAGSLVFRRIRRTMQKSGRAFHEGAVEDANDQRVTAHLTWSNLPSCWEEGPGPSQHSKSRATGTAAASSLLISSRAPGRT